MPTKKRIPISKSCEQCRTLFYPRPERADRIRFCKHACFFENLRARPSPETKQCRDCQKHIPYAEFKTYIKRGRTYTVPCCPPCTNARHRKWRLGTNKIKTIPRYALRPRQLDSGTWVKLCLCCNTTKPLSLFGKQRSRPRSRCKECLKGAEKGRKRPQNERTRERARQRYHQNREYYREVNRRYYQRLSREEKRRRMRRNRDSIYRGRSNRRARMRGAIREPISRAAIIKRDNSTCYLCLRVVTEDTIHLDHVIPLKRGGSHTYDNLRVACQRCNSRKKDRLVSELDWASSC